jgi:hypothetical protein
MSVEFYVLLWDDQESTVLKSLRGCKVEHVSKCEVD